MMEATASLLTVLGPEQGWQNHSPERANHENLPIRLDNVGSTR